MEERRRPPFPFDLPHRIADLVESATRGIRALDESIRELDRELGGGRVKAGGEDLVARTAGLDQVPATRTALFQPRSRWSWSSPPRPGKSWRRSKARERDLDQKRNRPACGRVRLNI